MMRSENVLVVLTLMVAAVSSDNKGTNYMSEDYSRKNLLENITEAVIRQQLGYYLHPCEKDWIYNTYNKKCLHSPGDVQNWFVAREQCRKRGGTLASFSTRHDIFFLSLIGKIEATTHNEMLTWVGAYSLEGNPWQWDSDEPWGNVELLLQPYENPARDNTCLAIPNDDQDGVVYKSCALNRFQYICQKPPLFLDDLSNCTHCLQQNIPMSPELWRSSNTQYYGQSPVLGDQYTRSPEFFSDIQNIKRLASSFLKTEVELKIRPCPEGWSYFLTLDKCYFTSGNDLLTWREARAHCHRLGGQLASFHSRFELQAIAQAGTIGNINRERSYSVWTGGHFVDGQGWRWDNEDEFWGDMDDHIHEDYYEDPDIHDVCLAVYNDDGKGAGFVDPYTRIPYDCESYRMPFACSMEPIRWPAQYSTDTGEPGIIRRYIQAKLDSITHPCDDGWIFYPLSGQCYFTDPHLRYSWFTAKNYCAEQGATLATFRSKADIKFFNHLCTIGKMTYNSHSKDITFEQSQACWMGLASRGGKPWGWDDGTPLERNVELYLSILHNPELYDTCVAVYPDDKFGVGYRKHTEKNSLGPARRLNCHKDRLPFLCQKKPRSGNLDHLSSYYTNDYQTNQFNRIPKKPQASTRIEPNPEQYSIGNTQRRIMIPMQELHPFEYDPSIRQTPHTSIPAETEPYKGRVPLKPKKPSQSQPMQQQYGAHTVPLTLKTYSSHGIHLHQPSQSSTTLEQKSKIQTQDKSPDLQDLYKPTQHEYRPVTKTRETYNTHQTRPLVPLVPEDEELFTVEEYESDSTQTQNEYRSKTPYELLMEYANYLTERKHPLDDTYYIIER